MVSKNNNKNNIVFVVEKYSGCNAGGMQSNSEELCS
jgi:hypothetical protein